MKQSAIQALKQEFYDWCSLLSIDEVVSNRPLIAAIERLERALIKACDRSAAGLRA